MNYSQTKQLDLLKNLGFSSPSWEDLGYILAALLTTAALAGAAWSWWDRQVHDPWLRLLRQARTQLRARGVASDDTTAPRALAAKARAQLAASGEALAQWLLAFETARYAPQGTASERAELARLRSSLKQAA